MPIVSNHQSMMGKPAIAGTQVAVESILERLAEGESQGQIIDANPRLSPDSIASSFIGGMIGQFPRLLSAPACRIPRPRLDPPPGTCRVMSRKIRKALWQVFSMSAVSTTAAIGGGPSPKARRTSSATSCDPSTRRPACSGLLWATIMRRGWYRLQAVKPGPTGVSVSFIVCFLFGW